MTPFAEGRAEPDSAFAPEEVALAVAIVDSARVIRRIETTPGCTTRTDSEA